MALSPPLTPQQRRSALEQLSRDRLIRLSDHFKLNVGDRRVAENHISAIIESKSADFGELLGLLKRDELQAICEGLGLDRGGREKDVLVQRILNLGKPNDGAEPTAQDASEADQPQAGMRKRARTEKSDGDLDFEAALWQAADKLRNNLDAAEY
ncbi:MAG: hypothetical protein EOO70_08090, partial [Myxococcaceae bacterium]